ncbi:MULTISPECIES: hypothetical protein [Halomonas]|uniref:hypothetical protein n=1 Tax=Halomonas TaxID=2745 RepID=UPI00128C084C|nr:MULTISPECIES: hypothetical protein [Halomonas]MDR5890392.1 hypothetical protein [Halomonas salina]WJY08118.1 hypothetical protein QWG60_04200 [Halomonas halophila]
MLIFPWLARSLSAFALEPEAQAAKDEGTRLYNIHQSTAALPYLEQAAAVSNLSSIYHLSKAVSPFPRGLPYDAMD